MATKVKSRIFGGLFRNRNSWNDKNNPSFSGLSWLQTCQNQLTVSLWRLYSHSGIRVARERAIVWLFPTIPILEYAPQKHALKRLKYLVYTGLVYKQYIYYFFLRNFWYRKLKPCLTDFKIWKVKSSNAIFLLQAMKSKDFKTLSICSHPMVSDSRLTSTVIIS